MNTTGLVMTVTDELLAELEEAASNATPGPWNYDGSYVCTTRQEGGTVYVESWNPVADALLSKNVKYIASANPATIAALTAELRRLRAENEEMAKDAGRYRHIVKYLSHWGAGVGRGVCMPSDYSSSTKEQCDASIDTAMATQ